MIPYSRHHVDDDDIAEVVEVLRSGWLTTGPRVEAFEKDIATESGVKHGVAVSSGTAALHAAMFALGIGRDDEVIVPSLTFLATANAAVYVGATPRFADVEEGSLLVSVPSVRALMSDRTKAIVAVDYAGQPCDYDELAALARERSIPLIIDAAHSIGARYGGLPVARYGTITTYSFHPVKHMTTTEGGMLVTDSEALAHRARMFRNHGVTSDHRQRDRQGTWELSMTELGYNYKLSDVACALGQSQLRKLHRFLDRRRALAARYDSLLAGHGDVLPLTQKPNRYPTYHLYVVLLRNAEARREAYTELRSRGIGVAVHYQPVHLQPFHRQRFGTAEGLCPVAESSYARILSLPIHPSLRDDEVDTIASQLLEIVETRP